MRETLEDKIVFKGANCAKIKAKADTGSAFYCVLVSFSCVVEGSEVVALAVGWSFVLHI